MQVSLVSEIPLKVPITSLDLHSYNLVISLSSGLVQTFIKHSSSTYEYSGGIYKISPPEIVRWYNSYILCGSSEGEIMVISQSKVPKELSLLFSQRIHLNLIKDIVWRLDVICTCSIDNYIKLLRFSSQYSAIMLTIERQIEAHSGWVTGLALNKEFLLSQGSDNVVTLWDHCELKKIKEIRYVRQDENVSIVSKPSGKDDWFVLAGTQSQLSGDGCVTVVNSKTFQIIELPLVFSPGLQTPNKLKRLRADQNLTQVQCSTFIDNYFIVAAECYILMYSISDFELVDEYCLEANTEITVICI